MGRKHFEGFIILSMVKAKGECLEFEKSRQWLLQQRPKSGPIRIIMRRPGASKSKVEGEGGDVTVKCRN